MLVGVLVLVVAVGVLVPRLWTAARSQLSSDSCTVGDYTLDPDQAAVAANMIGEVGKFGITPADHAGVLVLMAGLQESKLTNLAPGDGDRDSVGVLQQRPSQGWGGTGSLANRTQALTDVGEATREFLAALVGVPHWQSIAAAAAIQAVQISADGSAYAKQQTEATALARAFAGRAPAGLSCRFDAPSVVAPATRVAALASDQLGIDTPHAVGTAVQVPGAHWETAAWFVAYADTLGIDSVAYDGRRWTRADGWKQQAGISAAAVVATMARASG